jgi:uncharacterized protein YbjQ (UPF0145 family)
MRGFAVVLACLALVACHEGRPAASAGEEHGGEHGAVDDDDDKIPDDPATIAKAANVKVLQGDHLGCPMEALGPVDVHKKMESTPQALEGLKRRAAALGADAVMHVDFEHGEGGKEPTHLSGMAVRCNDLIKGRSYDVMGKVEVNGDMGGEEKAFAKLLGKAADMKADLLINVEFEHGEGGDGEPTKVRATAIKFRAVQ